MTRPVNPPQTLKTPAMFLSNNEAMAYFDQNRRILFQLWQKLGGSSEQMPGIFGTKSRLETDILTINLSVITLTNSNHRIDTQDNAATDTLEFILGGEDGDIVCLSANSNDRTITVRHRTNGIAGTIQCGADISLDNSADRITLERSGGVWFMTSFANNG